MAAGFTVRYWADSTIPLAHAIVELVRYARSHEDDLDQFEFGPLDVQAMREQGLTVSGPRLAGVTRLLEQVPGLHRY